MFEFRHNPYLTFFQDMDRLIDVNELYTFIAVEMLLGHRDGLAVGRNNYYLYGAGVPARLRLVPWGLDQAFPNSLSRIKWSFWGTAPFARPFFENSVELLKMQAMLKTVYKKVWNDQVLANRIIMMRDAIEGAMLPSRRGGFNSEVRRLEAVISQRSDYFVNFIK